MCILAGSGVGGGTRVNWCASFRTPPHVREEWAEEHGLDFMITDEYTEALDVVCGRLGVHCEPAVYRDASAVSFRQGLQV
jgi:long-chain-alcohol oxidase